MKQQHQKRCPQKHHPQEQHMQHGASEEKPMLCLPIHLRLQKQKQIQEWNGDRLQDTAAELLSAMSLSRSRSIPQPQAREDSDKSHDEWVMDHVSPLMPISWLEKSSKLSKLSDKPLDRHHQSQSQTHKQTQNQFSAAAHPHSLFSFVSSFLFSRHPNNPVDTNWFGIGAGTQTRMGMNVEKEITAPLYLPIQQAYGQSLLTRNGLSEFNSTRILMLRERDAAWLSVTSDGDLEDTSSDQDVDFDDDYNNAEDDNGSIRSVGVISNLNDCRDEFSQSNFRKTSDCSKLQEMDANANISICTDTNPDVNLRLNAVGNLDTHPSVTPVIINKRLSTSGPYSHSNCTTRYPQANCYQNCTNLATRFAVRPFVAPGNIYIDPDEIEVWGTAGTGVGADVASGRGGDGNKGWINGNRDGVNEVWEMEEDKEEAARGKDNGDWNRELVDSPFRVSVMNDVTDTITTTATPTATFQIPVSLINALSANSYYNTLYDDEKENLPNFNPFDDRPAISLSDTATT